MKNKTLYIHGLNSKPNQQKINLINIYSKVYFLHIDYSKQKDTFTLLSKLIENKNINSIIGSSFGGMLAYWLGKKYNIPSLLFNPAFGKENFINPFKKDNITDAYNLIVLGGNDEIVIPKSVISFIKKTNKKNYELNIIPEMGHRIDLKNFEKVITLFFKNKNIEKNNIH